MLVVKEKEVAKSTVQLQALQEEGQKDSAALEAAEQHFRAVSAGLSTNEDGEEATLAGQMMTCKNEMSKADTEAKQVNINTSCKRAPFLKCSLLFSLFNQFSKITNVSFLCPAVHPGSNDLKTCPS